MIPFFQLHVNDRPTGFLRHAWNEAADDAVRSGVAERHSARVIETAPCAEVRRVAVPLERLQGSLAMLKGPTGPTGPRIAVRPKRFAAEIMLLILSVILILAVAFGSKAKADGVAIMQSRGTTIVTPLGSANPHIMTIPSDLSVEAEERARQWEVFCKPVTVEDRYGVSRLQYAHEGCEYGRSK